jgi:hypothetical protein
MKRLALIVLGACALAAGAAADPSAKPTLAGVLRVAPRAHCGGAYIRDVQPPQLAPAPGVKLIVRKGKTNSTRRPAAEITTADDGTFRVELPRGRYCIVFEDKRDKPRKGGPYADLKCLVADWQRCDAVADVPSDPPVAIDRHLACFGPCYRGPRPP